jgi:hypothetical protein
VLSYFALGAALGILLPLASSTLACVIGGGLGNRRAGWDGEPVPDLLRLVLRWTAVGAAAVLLAWFVIAGVVHKPVEETERFALAIGGVKSLQPLDTFEGLLTRYAYGLFPWCVFVPFALAWVFVSRGPGAPAPDAASAGAADGTTDGDARAPLDVTLGHHAALHVMLAYPLIAYWHWRYYPAPALFVFPLALLIGGYLAGALAGGRSAAGAAESDAGSGGLPARRPWSLRFVRWTAVILLVLVWRDSHAGTTPRDFLALIGFPKPGEFVSSDPVFGTGFLVSVALLACLVLVALVVDDAHARRPIFAWYRERFGSRRAVLDAFRPGPVWEVLGFSARTAPYIWLAALAGLLVCTVAYFVRPLLLMQVWFWAVLAVFVVLAALAGFWLTLALLWSGLVCTVAVSEGTEAGRFMYTHLGLKLVLALLVLPGVVVVLHVLWRVSQWLLGAASALARGATVQAGCVIVSLVLGIRIAPALDAGFSLEPAASAAAEEGDLAGRLRLLQVEEAAKHYYPSLAEGVIVSDLNEAVDWLAAGTPQDPRYLVFSSKNSVLNDVNQLYRDKRDGRLVPVISAPHGRYLLAVSDPPPGRENRNPLARVILFERPQPRYAVLEGNFDDKVRYVGYDIDAYPDGSVGAWQKVTVTHYWQCTAKIAGDYQVFVHIDGMGDRINGDHDPAGGIYSTRYWRPGDYVVDRQEIRIPFHVRPARDPSAYRMLVGLFRGESRMPLKAGEGDDNRLGAGVLRVR